MLNLASTISKIEELLALNTDASLTYAALECRLAIEIICYERLRIAHDYISHNDLKKWQPGAVVKTLIEEVDSNSATEFTLSVSTRSREPGSSAPSKQEYEAMEFVEIGKQTGFNPRKMADLWNALANLALHVDLPMSKSDKVSQYGNPHLIRPKVQEALSEIRRISSGTLLSTGFGEVVSFSCICGQENKRRLGLLKDEQVVSCINPDCDESYDFFREGALFGRRTLEIRCRHCDTAQQVPKRKIEKLRTDQHIHFNCAGCGDTIYIAYRPMQTQKSR